MMKAGKQEKDKKANLLFSAIEDAGVSPAWRLV